MNQNGIFAGFCIWLFLIMAPFAIDAAEQDLAGSTDHPLIGRYEGSWIGGYDFSEFDEYSVVTGKCEKPDENALTVEGKITTIAYHVKSDISPLQLFRNYEKKISESGFKPIFNCKEKMECGSSFRNAFPIMPIPQMWGGSDYRYLAAKKSRPEGDVFVTLYCESLGGSGKTGCQVTIAETQPMEYKMVEAAEMALSISERGSVALYGIYFDFDQATIKPESKPSLGEISKLMEESKDLKIIVVGHTDNQGSYKYNMDLSKRRAEAVVRSLIDDYGISSDRLEHGGAGYLAPVSSNRTEEGRAKNRRVELVER